MGAVAAASDSCNPPEPAPERPAHLLLGRRLALLGLLMHEHLHLLGDLAPHLGLELLLLQLSFDQLQPPAQQGPRLSRADAGHMVLLWTAATTRPPLPLPQ